MIQLFHWMGAALLPLCGWLTGTALQAGKEQHILQLRHTVELLRRIRQEVAYRRPDMELLCRCLIQPDTHSPRLLLTGRAADACGKIAGSRAACKLPHRGAALF